MQALSTLLGAVLIYAITIGGTILASVIVRGYTLSVLWGWFVVPLFGLPALNIPLAFGLVLVATTLHPVANSQPKFKQSLLEPEDGWDRFGRVVGLTFWPLAALPFGWIILRVLGWQ